MARRWSSGFELNEIAKEWGVALTGSPTLAAPPGTGRGGSYAMRCNPSGATAYATKNTSAMGGGDVWTWRFYLYIATLPGAAMRIWTQTGSNSIILNTNGTLQVYNESGGANVGSASSALSTATWYRIEIQGTWDTDGTIAWLDGTQFCNATGKVNGSSFKLGCGVTGTTGTADLYFDDVAWNDSTGATQTGQPGSGTILHLYPNAAGDFAEGAAGGSSPAATAWQSMNTIPPADATTFWELRTDSSASSTSPDRVDVNVDAFSPSADSITLVQVGARLKPLTNASCSWVPRIKSQASGTLVEGTTAAITGTAFVTHDDTATAQSYKLTQYTDPQAGGAWTPTLLGTMQIGARAPDGAPNVDITSLWAVVEYVPATPATSQPVDVMHQSQMPPVLAM